MFRQMATVSLLAMVLASVSWAQGDEKTKPLVYPAPAQMKATGGVMTVGRDTRIVVAPGTDEKVRAVAGMLAEELGKALDAPGGKLTIAEDDGRLAVLGSPNILVTQAGEWKNAQILAGLQGLSQKQGAYTLTVTPIGPAAIRGRDAAGAYYGACAVLQLFTKTGPGKGEIRCAKIIDEPYHKYRGIRSTLPRGIPREGEITHEYYRNLLRLWGFCRLNHVWVQGCSWNTPLRRHPELGWVDELTVDQTKEIVNFAGRHFLSMDGSLDWQWLYYKYKHLAELNDGETWDDTQKKVRRMSRVNPCPSNPETWKLMYEMMEDTMAVLPGDHFQVSLDEMYQEYHGSRWAACPLCKGKDPVKLWAEMANKLVAKVLEKGKVPILGGGMLMYEHQGWYQDIYKAIDLIENRDKIVIYNWSEGHIRRGAMRIEGKRLQNPTFSATPFFKQHGYKDVVHLFAGTNWNGRPEMREVNGKLDCYGGFVSYYHDMNYAVMKEQGTIARLIFTAQHLWSPDDPPMESPEDLKMQRYGEAVADAICYGRSIIEAIEQARKAYAAPEGTKILTGGAMGRPFASTDAPVNLMGTGRGDRTEGTMTIVLPVEEANPGEAYLVLTINDWDQTGEGEIFLNGHPVELAISKLSNGRDYTFPSVRVPPDRLKFGPEPNVLRFVYKATAGFIIKRAEIIVCDAPGK